MVNEEFAQTHQIPLLERILPPGEIDQAHIDRAKLTTVFGADGDVYKSNTELPRYERDRRRSLGRFLSQQLVIKVAKDKPESRDSIYRQAEMITDPYIQPFAVASANPKKDRMTGRPSILLERATGYKLESDSNPGLEAVDYERIVYQLAMVYNRYHRLGHSAKDVGKDLFYRKQFDPKNPLPFADPPRIILYDLAYSANLRSKAVELITDIENEQSQFVSVLQEFFRCVPKSKLVKVQKVVGQIYQKKFQSLAQVAQALDPDGQFAGEYRRITGKAPEYVQNLGFSEAEFNHYIGTPDDNPPQISTIEEEELLTPAESQGLDTMHFYIISEPLMDLVRLGYRNRVDITKALFDKFSIKDIRLALTHLKDGRPLIDAMLDALERRGEIIGNRNLSSKVTPTEKLLELMRKLIREDRTPRNDLLKETAMVWADDRSLADPMDDVQGQYLFHLLCDYLFELGEIK